MATSKVDKWAAMVAEKRAATFTTRPCIMNGVGSLATYDLTAVIASKAKYLSHSDLSVADKPIVTPTTTPG